MNNLYKLRRKLFPIYRNLKAVEMLKRKNNGKKLICVEIGCFKGVNAKRMLNYLNIGKLYLIDIKKYNNFENWEYVKFLEMDGIEAADKIPDGLDYVFYDLLVDYDSDYGKHINNYDNMYIYLDKWIPKLKVGGMMSGRYFTPRCLNDVCAIIDYIKYRTDLKLYGVSNEWWIIKE